MRRLGFILLLGLAATAQAQWSWRTIPLAQNDSLRLEIRLADTLSMGGRLGQFNLRGRFIAGVDTSALPVLLWTHPDFIQSITPGILSSLWQLNAVLDAETGPAPDSGGVKVAVLGARLLPEADRLSFVLLDLPQTFSDDRMTRVETVNDTSGWTLDLSQSPVETSSPSAGGWGVSQPFPSPFTGQTTLRLVTGETVRVEGAVFDVIGRRVRFWPGRPMPSGVHDLTWDGRDGAGRPVAPGLYVWRLVIQGLPVFRKVIRLPGMGERP